MRSGGGKAKGSAFERDVCKHLSLWLSAGLRDDLLWRSAMSGGRATIGLRQGLKRTAQAGDISAIDSLGEALLDVSVIECKAYKDLQAFRGMLGGAGHLKKFWLTNKILARKVNKYSILIARQNGLPTFIMLDNGCVSLFDLPTPLLTITPWACSVYLFDDFLACAAVPKKVLEFKPKRNRL